MKNDSFIMKNTSWDNEVKYIYIYIYNIYIYIYIYIYTHINIDCRIYIPKVHGSISQNEPFEPFSSFIYRHLYSSIVQAV